MNPEIREISERMKASLSEIVFSLPNRLPSQASSTANPQDVGEEGDDLVSLKVDLVIAMAALKAEQERNDALSGQLDSLRTRFGALGTRRDEFAVIATRLAAECSRIDDLRAGRDRWAEGAQQVLNRQSQRRRLFGWMGRSRGLAPA